MDDNWSLVNLIIHSLSTRELWDSLVTNYHPLHFLEVASDFSGGSFQIKATIIRLNYMEM